MRNVKNLSQNVKGLSSAIWAGLPQQKHRTECRVRERKRHGVWTRNLAPFHWCPVGFHPALFLVFGPPFARSENWSKRGSRILLYGGRKPCRTKKKMGNIVIFSVFIPELEISDETILQTPTIIENNNIMNETDPNSKINNSKIIQFLELITVRSNFYL